MQSVHKLRLPVRNLPKPSLNSRSFGSGFGSESRAVHPYRGTLDNLRIGSHTRVIFQGFTGRQATANAKESIAWGTNIVGGVTPGREGEHLGLPVLPTVRRAMEDLKPDATGIYVAAHQAPAAIEEAIEAEVPLIVAVAEHIPLHDMLRIHRMIRSQSKSRLVGPNSPGIISAVGKCRIGFQPLPCFSPGRIGIIAKSGTLSYEAVASTTRAGLGQSICIGVGGDILPGTDLLESLRVLLDDPETEAIALIGEIGGSGEIEAARYIEQYYRRFRLRQAKPIVGLVAGINAIPGRVMGHAGAFIVPEDPSAKQKIAELEAAGVTMVNHPAKFGDALKKRLEALNIGSPQSTKIISTVNMGQARGMHTNPQRPRKTDTPRPTASQHQTRGLTLKHEECKDLLERLCISRLAFERPIHRYLAIGMDRHRREPAVYCANFHSSPLQEDDANQFERIPLRQLFLDDAGTALGLPEELLPDARNLATVFMEKEAYHMQLMYAPKTELRRVSDAVFDFDDAAFRSCGRQADLHEDLAEKNAKARDPAELEAQKHGIVYFKLPGDGNIGTLVNGAGLAMNTVDALADAGGMAANFLDTGGKATSETVKKSFEVILKDPRVKVIFVNIFGGLTLGDMIARGVIQAFEEVDINVPVVVRIRGTNEKEGQEIIEQSGLPLFAFDDFEDAAAKAIELANQEAMPVGSQQSPKPQYTPTGGRLAWPTVYNG